MSETIAQTFAEVFRREMADAEFTIEPVAQQRMERGYAYTTVRRGRVGMVTAGADITRSGFTVATEEATDAVLREMYGLGRP
jgi:hypothetical protein